MKKILTILVDGFEETEALFPIDLMRRVGIEVLISTPQDTLEVVSSHGVKIIVEKENKWVLAPELIDFWAIRLS